MPAPAAKEKGDSGLLIALGGPDKPMPMRGKVGSEPDGEETSMDAVKDLATEDAMAAFEARDNAGLKDALTRFVKACTSEDY